MITTSTKPNAIRPTGIVCISCGSTQFSVIRVGRTKLGIIRRRKCALCGNRISTLERPIVSGRATPPTTCIGQIEKSVHLLADRSSRLPCEPQN